MADIEDDDDSDVPDGAAVFPEIPMDLNVSPQLLAIMHAVVFIAGSDTKIVNAAAGDEALNTMSGYLERMTNVERKRILDDLSALRTFAKEQGWPKQYTTFLKDFPKDFGLVE